MNNSLSLIIPIFDVPNIYENLTVIDQELRRTGMPYEIIAINDGSDAVTTTRLNSLTLPNLKTFVYAQNQGKGYALRYGFDLSVGDIVGFIDADMQIHPQQISLFTSLMSLVDADIVIGSKRHPLSQVEYGPQRKLYSWGYQQLIKILFNLNIADTQVGIKLFKRHVLKTVIPRLVVKKWACDLEILVVAKHLGFKRILEAPVKLTWNKGKSQINWKVIPQILKDTLAIFYRKNILGWYNQSSNQSSFAKEPVLTNRNQQILEPDSYIPEPPFSFAESGTEEEITETIETIKSGIIFSAK